MLTEFHALSMPGQSETGPHLILCCLELLRMQQQASCSAVICCLQLLKLLLLDLQLYMQLLPLVGSFSMCSTQLLLRHMEFTLHASSSLLTEQFGESSLLKFMPPAEVTPAMSRSH